MRPWLPTFLFAMVAAAVAVTAVWAEETQTDAAPSNTIFVKNETEVVSAIGACLTRNKEAVLFSDHVQCADYRTGKQHLGKSRKRTV